MLENIVNTVIDTLVSQGIKAAAAYPKREPDRSGGPFVQVGVRVASQSDAAFAGYLGSREREDGQTAELYGMRCQMVLSLDIYASMASENGAVACLRCFDSCTLALGRLAGGLKIREITCGEAGPDRDSGMFLCRCQLKAEACLAVETQEEQAQFTDFILKGELVQ